MTNLNKMIRRVQMFPNVQLVNAFVIFLPASVDVHQDKYCIYKKQLETNLFFFRKQSYCCVNSCVILVLSREKL